MGLINCPKCGEKISSKALSCPHCNSIFSKQEFVKCEECGAEYEANMLACPSCGCPKTNSVENTRKKKHKGIIVSVVILAIISIIAVVGVGISNKANEVQYYLNMETVSYTMLDGAAKAETAGNLIKSVWYNAIYEERDSATDKYTLKNGKFVDDFNDALSNLFSDEEFVGDILEIEANQAEVTTLMKKLRNPPKKYEEAYTILEAYYDNYLKLTKAVVNPTGSLQTFSDDFNTYDTDTVNAYEKIKLYLD